MTGSAVEVDSSGSCNGIKVLVCGGRKYANQKALNRVLDDLHSERRIASIVEGGATGADALARTWAIMRDIPFHEYPAEWEKFGNSAGGIRNAQMLLEESPNLVIAFAGGSGTDNMVKIARANGTPVRDLRKIG